MGRYNKHLEDERILANSSAEVFTFEDSVLPALRCMAHPLDWEWIDNKGVPRKHKLEEFRDGKEAIGIVGNPGLIHDLSPTIRIHLFGKSPKTHEQFLRQLRFFWRFLANTPNLGPDNASYELNNIGSNTAEMFYSNLRSAVKVGAMTELSARQHWSNFCSLMTRAQVNTKTWPYWPSPRSTIMHKDVHPRAVKYLYDTAKRLVADGRALHASGQAVLGRLDKASDLIELTDAHRPGPKSGYGPEWSVPNNILYTAYCWFIARLTGSSRSRESPATLAGINKSILRLGSIEEAPGSAAWTTLTDLYPLFAPTSLEVVAALTLVTAETGWIDTARAIDVSSDWYRDGRRQVIQKRSGGSVEIREVIISGPETAEANVASEEVEISATRPKTSRRHQTRSLVQSEQGFRAYAVIKYMIERTRLLRGTIENELVTLRRIRAPTPECQRRISELDELIRCPWLFFRARKMGGVSGFTANDSPSTRYRIFDELKGLAVAEAVRRGETTEVQRAIVSLTISDFRDAYAAWVYNRTGSDIFAVQAALNHRGINTTRRYLRQKAQIRQRFAACARLMGAGFGEVQAKREIDPTILRLLVDQSGQEVTDADRASLTQFRSSCGAWCLSPTNPPEEIEPASERAEGELCGPQRCGICKHARFDIASLRGIAVRIGELKALSAVTPVERWLLSIYSVELEALELLVEEKFANQAARVWSWAREHRKRLERGDTLVFGAMSIKTASELIVMNRTESTR